MHLDITLSDHYISTGTIEAFGEVIRAIRLVCPDDDLRFGAFIRFVSLNHPEIFTVKMPPEHQAECDAVLARAQPPPVKVEESFQGSLKRRYEESGSQDQDQEMPGKN